MTADQASSSFGYRSKVYKCYTYTLKVAGVHGVKIYITLGVDVHSDDILFHDVLKI